MSHFLVMKGTEFAGSFSTMLLHGLQVRKAVYASTTKSQLNLTNRKVEESNPSLTYPDMSFAVDNFEEAFDSLVSLVSDCTRT